MYIVHSIPRDFWMICILQDRFNVTVPLRYYRAMSPGDEWQPRQIFSARRVRQFVMANTLQACLGLLAKTVGRCRRRRCKPLMTLCRYLRAGRCVAVLSFLEEGRPLSRSPPIVGAVVDDNDDDYDVLSSAITAQVAP